MPRPRLRRVGARRAPVVSNDADAPPVTATADPASVRVDVVVSVLRSSASNYGSIPERMPITGTTGAENMSWAMLWE
jgi:hypothetical protein